MRPELSSLAANDVNHLEDVSVAKNTINALIKQQQEKSEANQKATLPFEFSEDDLRLLKAGSDSDKALLYQLCLNHSDEISRKKKTLRKLYLNLFPIPETADLEAFIGLYQSLIYLEILQFNSLLIQQSAGAKEAYLSLIEDLSILKQLGGLDDVLNDEKSAFLSLNPASLSTFNGLVRYFSGQKGQGLGTEKLDELQYNPTRRLLDTIADVNFYRLYSMWALGNGGALDSLYTISELTKLTPFINWDRFQKRLSTPGPFLSGLSYQMYLFRLSLNSALIFKHYFCPSAKEKILNDIDRLNQEIRKRKYLLWNDSVWFFVNGLCATILMTSISPLLGSIGGLLNVGLMVSDYLMVVDDKKHCYQTYLDEKKKLEAVILQLSQDSSAHAKKQRIAKEQELALLEEEWLQQSQYFSRLQTTTIIFMFSMALMYAPDFALCLAGLLASSPFLSAFLVAAPWLMLVGGLLSLTLNIVEVHGVHHDNYLKAKADLGQLEEKLDALNAKIASLDENTDEALLNGYYCQKSLLEKEIAYTKQLIIDEKRKADAKVVLMAIAPVVLFALLNISSFPLMLASVLLMAVLTIAANYQLDKVLTKASPPTLGDDITSSEKTLVANGGTHQTPFSFFKAATKVKASPNPEETDNKTVTCATRVT